MNDTSLYAPPSDPIEPWEVVYVVGFTLAFLIAASCGTRTYDCVDDGLDEALAEACERWPETCDVGERLDVFCKDDVDTFQTCGRSEAENIKACTVWLGGGPYRARMYVLNGESLRAAATHEAQHWHLELTDPENEGCPTHEAACGWSEP